MPVGNRFYTPPKLTGNVSITLPDGQQFFAPKALDVSTSGSDVIINLQTAAAPVTYAAGSELGALQVKADIIRAATTQSGGNATILAPGSSFSATISGTAPDPIVADTVQVVFIQGTGFTDLPPFRVVTLLPDLSYAEFTGITVISTLSIECDFSPSLPAGAYTLYLVDYTTYAVFASAPLTSA